VHYGGFFAGGFGVALDTRERRWLRCRGRRWRPGQESGSSDELKGAVAPLQLADGYGCFPALLVTSLLETAGKGAKELARVCGLPPNETVYL
jgi:hypothetical protein